MAVVAEQKIGEQGAQREAGNGSMPSITLPKGGGAVRGVGEKFAANPVTGTGSMTVPIATSPGRSGFGPKFSLSYDSGSGNGPFGFGWSLSVPSITRKTDKGLPQYLDADDSDVFILSGAEDLVPMLAQNAQGAWERLSIPMRTVNGVTYRIDRYRPRIEGLFARIERWTNTADAKDVFWRSISKDNITTWYGRMENSRIADPSDATRVFSWLICQTHDDKGNVIVYDYKPEDSARIFEDATGNSISKVHELNRPGASRSAQRYLKRICYGNRSPYFPVLKDDAPWPEPPAIRAPDESIPWCFEVVFDYGEHDAKTPTPNDAGTWPARRDPFSSYRAGFEVRTYRICQRVLMFHHFLGEAGVDRNCLVRSTDFTYSDEISPTDARNPVYTFLRSVTQTSYRRNDGGYERRSVPPVEFEYTEPVVQDTVEEVDPSSIENLPIGLDGSAYRWTDLHGEGIPGILTEQAGAWFYKRNFSPISNTAQFAPLETVALKPNLALSGGAEFMDLAGDGQPDLVVMEGPMPGFYEHDEAEGWQPFRPFTSRLNRDMGDPNLKFVDLDGDGHADVLITENEAFVWHASLAEAGFGPACRVAQALDEEKGPRVVFADGTQSIYLADLSGDGLTDIVRIRNGEVCYWPSLGYGRFGAKVSMDNSPHFDDRDQFDQKRIRLADIDGSGTTDIIYLHRDGVHLYFNQSGNGWSARHVLTAFPRIDNAASIVPMDLLGNGTACLVWSSPLPGDARRPMRYVNLMGGQKPHLLVRTINNLGAETRVHYAPSTRFYLQDKLDGKPWITRLPFPVHVVERVETWDHISKNRFVTRYAYHHGYFDGEEREFRGFGMVEQWDTEEIGAQGALINAESSNWDATSSAPPVHTKTWFHTGAYLGRDRVSNYFAGLLDDRDSGEYYPSFRSGDAAADAAAKALLLEDTILPAGLSIEEEREACRALKGSMLRQEIYAEDNTEKAKHPYTVTEQNFTIKRLQAKGNNRHAVFFTHPREAISYQYERNPVDPRIQHALTLEVDDYGNVLKSVAIGYGRRGNQSPLQGDDRKKQEQLLITYTETGVTNAVDDAENHRTPLPCDIRTYELTGLIPENGAHRFSYDELTRGAFARIVDLAEAPYEEKVDYTAQRKRLIEHVRTLYRPNDCGVARNDPLALLPLGAIESMALPGESYKLAFTPGLAKQIYVDSDKLSQVDLDSMLADEGRYVHSEGDSNWWIPSGRAFYSPGSSDTAAAELALAQAHFFLPRRYRDPFHKPDGVWSTETFVDYDAYDLLTLETRDALGNRVTAGTRRKADDSLEESGIDYRVLQPKLMMDPNRNRTEVAFDVLGMVVGTAVMGKPDDSPQQGDRLDPDFKTDLTQAEIDGFYAPPFGDPHEAAVALLRDATTRIVYDLDRFRRSRDANPDNSAKWEAPFAATLARETHASASLPPQGVKIQISFSYSDGFGREIQKKIQAEKGKAPQRDAQGKIIVGPDNQPVMSLDEVAPRWVGSGWTVFNNKGKPVRQYEPFFSDTHKPDFDTKIGVSPVLFYDPVERVVATLHPNHTYEKVVFDPWQQTTFDVNDTCAPRNDQTGDPRTDPDIGGYVKKCFEAAVDPSRPWQTWHAQRIGGTLGADEQNAAQRAAAHADTPTTAHFDALGRPFLTIARNRVICKDHALDGKPDETFCTRVELDIEGNQREVLDERKLPDADGLPLGALEQRIVMQYGYDMLGNRIHQESMEAGARWMLNDVAGKPIRSWDSRGHEFKTGYDALHRPVAQYVRGTTTDSDPRTGNSDQAPFILIDKIEYGESLPDAESLNLRTRIYRHYDSAGVVINAKLDDNGDPVEAFDFKGNPLHVCRQLVKDYKAIPDWSAAVDLEKEADGKDRLFTSHTAFDALNRPLSATSPDGSIYRPTFNEANLLEKVDVHLRGAAVSTSFVRNIDYDAKGQRKLIEYGSGATGAQKGVTTTYDYDAFTFRLVRLTTKRPANLNGLASQLFKDTITVQDLCYTYDPAGNITHIVDEALLPVNYDGQHVDPACDYVYDALYRLIQATGREHIGQAASLPQPSSGNFRDYPYVDGSAVNDAQALRNYTERYVYDAVGNFLSMEHRAANGNWTRAYAYDEESLVEAGRKSNRLSGTTLRPNGNNPLVEPYRHDAHGNMTNMPHLPLMRWDYRDQLMATAQQEVNDGTPETTWYAYDAAGQRVRKVTESMTASGDKPRRRKERLYLGGFEVYREYEIDGVTPKLERESLHVMDDRQRIALAETQTIENGTKVDAPVPLQRYQFGNHLGSASLELAADGALISYEEYRPYGTSSFQAGRSAAEVSLKRYRYTGKERDEENGFYYHGARYYATWLGRWLSTDPIGVEDGINIYVYVGCRPLACNDPSGMATNNVDKMTHDEVKAILADPTAHSFDVLAAAHAKNIMLEHQKRVELTGTGLVQGVHHGGSVPSDALLLDCTSYVQEVLKRTYESLGRLDEWRVIEARALQLSADAQIEAGADPSKVKSGITGIGLQRAFSENGEMSGLYFNKDVTNPAPGHKKPEEHTYSYRIAKKQGTYYGNPVDQARMVTNYSRTGQIDSWFATNSDALSRLQNMPFGIVAAHGGDHMAMVINGAVYEVHWKGSITDKNTVEATPIEDWIYKSGSIFVPTNTLDTAWPRQRYMSYPDGSVIDTKTGNSWVRSARP